LHAEWLALAESLKNPGGRESVQLVIDGLRGVEKWRK
jgi:hypothetical protein